VLWKSKEVCKEKFNNISGQLEVLVYSLKRSRAWKLNEQMSVNVRKNHVVATTSHKDQ